MTRRKREEQLRAAAAQLLERPVLVDGDAAELLALLRQGIREPGIHVADFAELIADGEHAGVAVLAISSDGRRSSLMKATLLLREMDAALAPTAIRIVVVQSDRSRKVPDRIQRALGTEILYQATLALLGLGPHDKWRSFRQRAGLATLDAAGLRILRFA